MRYEFPSIRMLTSYNLLGCSRRMTLSFVIEVVSSRDNRFERMKVVRVHFHVKT